MDDTDVKLLNLLAADADVTATALAPALNLSVPAINKRIARLRSAGVIRQYTVLLDGEKVGKPIQAFVLLVLEKFARSEALMELVRGDPDVLDCHAVTGEYDYILHICARDIGELEKKLLTLKSRCGLAKSYTLLSLMEHKHQATPLPDETKE